MTAQIAIVADDLTSAADAAGPFRKAGLTARIALRARDVSGTADVVALDTGSRQLAPAEAAAKTVLGIRAVSQANTLIKTIDSTLRGNLASEITAALTASGRAVAVVAPAFPAEGRTTVDGVQLLNGVPVHRTSFATDQCDPTTGSNLFELVPGAVGWAVDSPLPRRGIVVVDADSDADLDMVVARIPDDHRVLWVGSPGLAAALARRRYPESKPIPAGLPAVRRTLAVVGSRNDVSRKQLLHFVPREHIADVGGGQTGELVTTIATWLAGGLAGMTDESTASTPEQSAARLAGIVAALHDRQAFDAVFITGGATARALLDELRVRTLDLLDEPEPGIVVALVRARDTFLLVLKAGGFGDVSTFRRLYDLCSINEAKQELR